jgi:hypothetical protein
MAILSSINNMSANMGSFPASLNPLEGASFSVAFDSKLARCSAFFSGVNVRLLLISALAEETSKTLALSTQVAVRAVSLFRDFNEVKERTEIDFKRVFQAETSFDAAVSKALAEFVLGPSDTEKELDVPIKLAYEAAYFSRAANRAYFRAQNSFRGLSDAVIAATCDPAIATNNSRDQAKAILDAISSAFDQVKAIEADVKRIASMSTRTIGAALATVVAASESKHMFSILSFLGSSAHENILSEASIRASHLLSDSVDVALRSADSAVKAASICEIYSAKASDAFATISGDRAFNHRDVIRALSIASEAASSVVDISSNVDKKAQEADLAFLRATFSLVQNKATSVVASWMRLPDNDKGRAIARAAAQALCSDEAFRADVDRAFVASKLAIKADQNAIVAIDRAGFFAIIGAAVAADGAAAIADEVSAVADGVLAQIGE